MLNDKNASIRYLMKEMDPSEEVLIERAMMEDEDLLIEVECMRRTLKRLNDSLPSVDPPSHLTDKIIKMAAERQSAGNPVSNVISSERFRYVAAAASILFAAVIGMIWYQFDAGSSLAISHPQAHSASVTSSSYVISPVSINGVEPWIDRNDVLRFQDQFGSQHNQVAFDSILNNSTRKLKPIDESLHATPRSRALQLTGSDEQ